MPVGVRLPLAALLPEPCTGSRLACRLVDRDPHGSLSTRPDRRDTAGDSGDSGWTGTRIGLEPDLVGTTLGDSGSGIRSGIRLELLLLLFPILIELLQHVCAFVELPSMSTPTGGAGHDGCDCHEASDIRDPLELFEDRREEAAVGAVVGGLEFAGACEHTMPDGSVIIFGFPWSKDGSNALREAAYMEGKAAAVSAFQKRD